ncbi:MAG: MATE family efflux transporter [Candidatus Methanomethylophilaceae archaeon]|nr:MATE family efflux transporter [Candidatus Methanomethylophilaceae archaeon]
MSSMKSIDILLGNPQKAIRMMALPLILSLLVSQVNVLADRAWCSGLGVDTMAAVAVVMPIYMTISGLGSGLGVGASAVISRMIGAENKDKACSSAVQALIFGAIFGIVLTAILIPLGSNLLSLLGAGEVLDIANSYFQVYAIFTLLIVMNGVIAGILNGQGATGLSTIMMIAMALTNIVMDPILIYGMDLGIRGASIATIISTMVSIILGIYFIMSRRTYLSLNRSHFIYDRMQMRSVMKAGIPQMIEYAIMWSMDAALNFIVIQCAGAEGLTIYSTPDNLINLIVIPAMAIGSALVPVASSALGQNDMERMRASFRYALKVGILAVVVLVMITEIFAEQALFIFTYSGEMEALRPTMTHALRIMCLYASFFAFTPICSGYLQAMGRPNRSVGCALWRNAVLITFFSIFSSIMGLDGIFWALLCGHMVGAVTIFTVSQITQRRLTTPIEPDSRIA